MMVADDAALLLAADWSEWWLDNTDNKKNHKQGQLSEKG